MNGLGQFTHLFPSIAIVIQAVNTVKVKQSDLQQFISPKGLIFSEDPNKLFRYIRQITEKLKSIENQRKSMYRTIRFHTHTIAQVCQP